MLKCYLLIFTTLALLVSTALALEPGLYDITMQSGEDYRLEMTMKDGTGNLVDLTGYSYKAQFRQSPAPAGALYATYSTVFVNMTGGRVDVRLSAAQTAATTGKSGVWDLRETSPSGVTTYKAGGKAVCKPTVTR